MSKTKKQKEAWKLSFLKILKKLCEEGKMSRNYYYEWRKEVGKDE